MTSTYKTSYLEDSHFSIVYLGLLLYVYYIYIYYIYIYVCIWIYDIWENIMFRVKFVKPSATMNNPRAPLWKQRHRDLVGAFFPCEPSTTTVARNHTDIYKYYILL